VGNRADASNPGSYVHDANNRLTARPGLTYTYDDAGALTGRSDGATFTHDAANRLVQFEKAGTVASYLYDAAGRRIRKTVNGTSTWYLWEDNRLLAEYDAAGTRVRRYAYLPHSPAAVQVEDANGVYYAHNDNVHTALMLTGSAGQVTWRARRESFGKALVEEDVDANGIAVTNNLRFPGQVWDGESGLHYNVMRYFDPEPGRYIEADPIGLRGGINLYAYATGSPATITDPLGLYSWSDVFAAYRHYCGRSGTSWSVSFTSLSWVTDPVTGMTQYIQNLTAGMGGICQDATIPINHSQGFQTTGADAALIGRHSFTLTGTLTTGCDCNYSFSGNVQSSQGWELYNFNPSNRSMPAEIATAIGRNTCFWGRPFRINITGSQSVQSSGKTGGKDTCCKG
jgi:RHS repeat-associated protein